MNEKKREIDPALRIQLEGNTYLFSSTDVEFFETQPALIRGKFTVKR